MPIYTHQISHLAYVPALRIFNGIKVEVRLAKPINIKLRIDTVANS